jgi:hypothetical protein
MPSAKTNPATTLADATAKTRSMIESLQAKLSAEAGVSAKNGSSESIEDLERQLQSYFERTAPSDAQAARRSVVLDELRSRVIDRVVDRILADWADPNSPSARSALAQQVMERLTERLLEELQKTTRL